MRGWAARRAVTGAVRILSLTLLVGVTAACGGSTGSHALPVPTFAASSAPATAGPAAARDGALPDDCGQLLSAADLAALFAQPLDSVVVRTVRGVAEPSVGRTARVGCRYTSVAGQAKGNDLLELNVGRYTDEAAASRQWQLNSAAERAGGGQSRDLPIGSATAVLVERPGDAVLMVGHGLDTLTFVLPGGPVGGRPVADTLVDLALRVLPQVGATAPAASPVAPHATGTTRTAALEPAAAAPRPRS